jgi:hypothetical protein
MFEVSIKPPLFKELGDLFQSKKFYELYAQEFLDSRYYIYREDENIFAHIYFNTKDRKFWQSPIRGTFSGFAFDSSINLDIMSEFYDFIESDLLSNGAKRIDISLPPIIHSDIKFSKQAFLLFSKNYIIKACEINHSLKVKSDFRSFISRGNLKRIKKCLKEDFKFAPLSHDNLEEAYKVLEINRAFKGNNLSMSLQDLEDLVSKFSDAVFLFGIRSPHHELVAASICISINEEILYVFYWGDLPDFSSYSPIALLAEGIYIFAKENGYGLIDAGTSSIEGILNTGLSRFKNNLGFQESIKITLTKELH